MRVLGGFVAGVTCCLVVRVWWRLFLGWVLARGD